MFGGGFTKSVGAAAANPEWLPITDADVSALSDPSSITQGATGVSGSTFTWEAAEVALQINGFDENMARYTVQLSSLLPSFSVTTEILELGIKLTSFPTSNTDWGCAIGIFDGASPGTLAGGMFGVYDNGASRVLAHIGSTALAATNGIGTGTLITGTFQSTRVAWQLCTAASDSGVWNEQINNTGGNLTTTDPTGLYLHLSAFQQTISPTAGTTIVCEYYYRAIPRGVLLT